MLMMQLFWGVLLNGMSFEDGTYVNTSPGCIANTVV
jgi:hypothetical protein